MPSTLQRECDALPSRAPGLLDLSLEQHPLRSGVLTLGFLAGDPQLDTAITGAERPQLPLQAERFEWFQRGSHASRQLSKFLAIWAEGSKAGGTGHAPPVSTNPQKDIRDLQCELDKEQGQTRKAIVKTGPSSGKAQKSGSFEAVAVAVIGLILSAVAVVSVGRMSEVDRRALAIGLTSGAAGLAVGYGVGRVRR